jgi:dihydroflavonol-4-reductase
VAYVDVRDCAEGHVRAAEQGRAGRRYIVAGHNIDNKALLQVVSRAAGRRSLSVRLPKALVVMAAHAMQRLALAQGRRPDLAVPMLAYGMRECFYDSRRAREELGLRFRPFEETVEGSVAWFREAGML